VVTAGNASGICDGSAAVVIAGEGPSALAKKPQADRTPGCLGNRGRRAESTWASAPLPPRGRRSPRPG
jgi:acetyl-CoA acetyltransferase